MFASSLLRSGTCCCCLLALNGEENPEIPAMFVSVGLLIPCDCKDEETFVDLGTSLRGCWMFPLLAEDWEKYGGWSAFGLSYPEQCFFSVS